MAEITDARSGPERRAQIDPFYRQTLRLERGSHPPKAHGCAVPWRLCLWLSSCHSSCLWERPSVCHSASASLSPCLRLGRPRVPPCFCPLPLSCSASQNHHHPPASFSGQGGGVWGCPRSHPSPTPRKRTRWDPQPRPISSPQSPGIRGIQGRKEGVRGAEQWWMMVLKGREEGMGS